MEPGVKATEKSVRFNYPPQQHDELNNMLKDLSYWTDRTRKRVVLEAVRQMHRRESRKRT